MDPVNLPTKLLENPGVAALVVCSLPLPISPRPILPLLSLLLHASDVHGLGWGTLVASLYAFPQGQRRALKLMLARRGAELLQTRCSARWLEAPAPHFPGAVRGWGTRESCPSLAHSPARNIYGEWSFAFAAASGLPCPVLPSRATQGTCEGCNLQGKRCSTAAFICFSPHVTHCIAISFLLKRCKSMCIGLHAPGIGFPLYSSILWQHCHVLSPLCFWGKHCCLQRARKCPGWPPMKITMPSYLMRNELTCNQSLVQVPTCWCFTSLCQGSAASCELRSGLC